MRRIVVAIVVILFAYNHIMLGREVGAQDTPTPVSGLNVQIEAADGKTLYGSYFASSQADGPALLLLHQLYTNRSSWDPLIPLLLDSGFKVLTVDLRGYGQTRGKIKWKAAQQDTLDWANWLTTQPGVTSLALIGSSMGSNLALVGCTAVEGCAAVVAISPSLDYFGVKTADAVQAGFPILVVYADHDTYPRQDMPEMLELGGDHITTIHYPGRTHGMDLFSEYEDLGTQIVGWLQAL